MTYYPVVIPTLCRYEHFKNCVDSLSKNFLAGETELVIGLDFPPSEKYIEGWKKIKDYILHITGFKKVTCFERTENYGSSKNSDDLKNYVLSKYDAYIYSEDDNIFSPYFLQYMNDGLDKYKNDDSVFAVCGYSYPIDWKTDKDCILQHQYFSAWGYGMWKDREEKFRKDISNSFFARHFNSNGINKLKQSPANFIEYIGHAFADSVPDYDISRSFYMFLNDLNILMPVKSLVTNDGWDGSGQNCKKKTDIDFSNFNRNDIKPINVDDVSLVFSNELENAILALKPRNALIKAKVKCFLIKLLGFDKSRKLKKFIKRQK